MAYTRYDIANHIAEVLKLYPVQRGALFGSYARNEQTNDSDVDLLLDLGVDEKYPHADYIYDLLDTLEAKLKLRVDFVTVNGMKTNPSKMFKRNVESECWWFYEV